MQRKKRRLLISGLFLVFFLAGGYILIVAQGLIVDLKHFRVVKTGGLFLKFDPPSASLLINNKPINTSRSLLNLNSGVLIKNLLPGEYRISISKTGFTNWKKNLKVLPGIITSATGIKLWPEKPVGSLLTDKKVRDFWPIKKGIIYKDYENKLRFQKNILKGEEVRFREMNSDFIVTTHQGIYLVTDLRNPQTALNLNYLFNSLKEQKLQLPGTVPIKFVFPHPFSKEKILIGTNTSFYILDLQKIDLEKIISLEKIFLATVSGNDVYLILNGEIAIINLILKTKTFNPLQSISEIIELKVGGDSNKILFLTKDGGLYIYDREKSAPRKIASDVKQFEISTDNRKVAFLNRSNEVWVYYLEDYKGDFEQKKDSRLKIYASRNFLRNLEWLNDSNYFFVVENGNLVVGELDAREPLNSHIFSTGVKKYEYASKNLYILGENGELIKMKLDI